MQDLELQQLLVQTSLIHIFIVSGSHFLFLHNILARVMGKRFWTLIPLALYALITLCQPPSVRSLLFLILAETARQKKYFSTKLQIVFVSAILTVAFFPQWIHSRSFLMSLLAALAMAIAADFLDHKTAPLLKLFLTQVSIYFVMGFCLWGFSNLHPLSILLNATLGPLIGGVLFPLALIVVFIPFLGPIFDSTMDILTWILQRCSEVLKAETLASPLGMLFQWSLFLIFIVIGYQVSVQKKRRRYEN